MILAFTFQVEVSDRYGEEHVPQIRHAIDNTFRHVPGVELKNVQYEAWLTKPESHYRILEQTVDAEGRLPL